MKFPVLWPSFVSVWAGTGKVICLGWDLVSRSHTTLHFCAKVVEKKILLVTKKLTPQREGGFLQNDSDRR